MALGAEPAAVLRLVLHQAMRLSLWGAGIGALIAFVAGAIVSANIYGTPSIDPLMFVASAATLASASLLTGHTRALTITPVPRRPLVFVVFCLCLCGATALLPPDDTNVVTCKADRPEANDRRDDSRSHLRDAQLQIAAIVRDSVWKCIDVHADLADVRCADAVVVTLADHFPPEWGAPVASHAFLSPLLL